MGSPLAPALANLFMGHNENLWLKDPKASKVILYKRYVDDIFCLFSYENEYQEFFDFINSQHPNIRFTFEKEHEGTLPFLDVFIRSMSNNFDTTTYYKKTYTGLLTSFSSFTPLRYKIGLIRTLIDRAYKINSTVHHFQNNLDRIKKFLQKNGFPSFLINKHAKRYLDSKDSPTTVDRKPEPRYYKLPYISSYSNILKNVYKN